MNPQQRTPHRRYIFAREIATGPWSRHSFCNGRHASVKILAELDCEIPLQIGNLQSKIRNSDICREHAKAFGIRLRGLSSVGRAPQWH